MEYTYKATYLSNNLKLLIKTKSARDGRRFSAGQLAEAIGAPRSLISRLISDSAKNTVKNPRIETLYKIARYFYEDGFSIDVNDLLDPNANLLKLLQHPKVHISKKLTLPLLDIENTIIDGDYNIHTRMPVDNVNLLAYQATKAICETFGYEVSSLIVDTKKYPTDGMLYAWENKQNKRIKFTLCENAEKLMEKINSPTTTEAANQNFSFIGTVIQANIDSESA